MELLANNCQLLLTRKTKPCREDIENVSAIENLKKTFVSLLYLGDTVRTLFLWPASEKEKHILNHI